MAYVEAIQSLPRSLDVQISLSRPQTETRTDLSTMCVACESLGFFPDENRVRFYSTLAGVATDFASNTQAYLAASAFFSQTPRATTLAIGEVFLSALHAQLLAPVYTTAEITAIAAVTTGSFTIAVDGAAAIAVTGLDFTGVTTAAGIAAVIDAAFNTAVIGATCTTKTLPGGSARLLIKSDTTGATSTLGYAGTHTSGTDVSAMLKLTAATSAMLAQGYTPVDIAEELTNIQNAANAAGKFIYGWALGSTLRDVAIQTVAAAWALTQTAFMALVTNSADALNPATETDIGFVVNATGNRRVTCLYHDNATRYPDVSILAYMLHVNYRLQDSTVTSKFKQLPGIETVVLTETQLSTLIEKGYNTYVAIGNSSRTFREGGTSDPSWWMDSTINLDNFVEDLSVNVFNVFLRNKKVPYTRRGVALLVDACTDTGTQYTYNGTFADRVVVDTTKKGGTTITPAVVVTPTPIEQMSDTDRASRIGPPIQITCQEAGAIHSVSINVDIVS